MTSRLRSEFEHVQRRARRAVYHGNAWVQVFARSGHATKGVAYGIAGVIAILFALHRGEISGEKPSVVVTILREPVGGPLMTLLGLGLTIQGLWLFAEGLLDFRRRGRSLKARVARFGTVFRGGVHLGVAVYVFMLVVGASHAAAGQAARGITGFFMKFPAGTFAVGAVGLGILLYGLGGLVRAFRIDLEEELELGEMSRARYDVTIVAAHFGLVARGVVFGLIGLFVFLAALRSNPGEAKGVGEVLATVRDVRFGTELLCVIGAGLVAYGIYELIRARYIRVESE